ncbi:acyltransferase family protein [Paenibacillus psychroresistens]|nr:acyltransferase [Paenibacillus psychroresistens]
MPERYQQLDALRGLAALTVVLQHFLSVLPSMDAHSDNAWVNLWKYSPLHITWAGYEAVIFFFILSGFVLSLPFYGDRNTQYSSYAFKRICRIYLPYVVAILIAMLVSMSFSKGDFAGASDWFNGLFKDDFTWKSMFQHMFLIGIFDFKAFNPVVWSLIHEMRISLIFPFIMFFVVNRLNWKITLSVAVILSVIGSVLNSKFSTPATVTIHYFITIHYIAMFIVGALLAKHRYSWIHWFKNVQKSLRVTGLLIGVLAYTYSYWFFPGISFIHLRLIDNWVISLGAVLFIMFSLTSQTVSQLLAKSALLFVGKTSYSIYLYHLIVLYVFMQFFNDNLPLWVIYILTLVVTFVLSKFAYSHIELPSVAIGKWGAKYIKRGEKSNKAPSAQTTT